MTRSPAAPRKPPRAVDRLVRRVAPRLIVALSQVTWPARLAAAVRRGLRRDGRVELFFAFDDPCSAVAVLDLADRVTGRDVRLTLRPVVTRGIPDDPAVDQKRRYAVIDARRLARRLGRRLRRDAPLEPATVAFLAGWVAAGPEGPALNRFTVRALEELWFGAEDAVHEAPYAALWRKELGTQPPGTGEAVASAVRESERQMRRRGPYDTPAAWVHGQWFFAHDRSAQIADRLDDLGWVARP